MKTLPSATIAAALVSCALSFAGAALAQESAKVVGDAAAGQKKNATCIGCHGIVGYQASFPQIYKVPMIAGQGAPYIVSALNAYKKGERKHPTMRGISETLTAQDMADLGAYYEAQGGPRPELPAQAQAPDPLVAALLTKGNCAACHGANYSKPIDPSYPKLAGQHADYLYVALKAYTIQDKAVVGRNNAIMSAQVKAFNQDELKRMAKYFASLPGDLKTVPQSKFK